MTSQVFLCRREVLRAPPHDKSIPHSTAAAPRYAARETWRLKGPPKGIYPLDPPRPEAYMPLYDISPDGGMVDALASGASVRMDVEVRVLFWAPRSNPKHCNTY